MKYQIQPSNKTLKKFFIVLITLFIQLFISCYEPGPCKEQIIVQDIPQGYRNLIPYKGGELLYFFDTNLKDTVKYVADSTWTYYYNSSYSGADCAIETKRQGRGISLVPDNGDKTIFINQNKMQDGFQYEIDCGKTHISTTDFITNSRDTFQGLNKKYINVGFFSDDNQVLTNKFGCYYSVQDGIIMLYSNQGDTLWLINK